MFGSNEERAILEQEEEIYMSSARSTNVAAPVSAMNVHGTKITVLSIGKKKRNYE